MAIKKCKKCGIILTKKADNCPKCGYSLKTRTSLFTWTIIVLFLIYLALPTPDKAPPQVQKQTLPPVAVSTHVNFEKKYDDYKKIIDLTFSTVVQESVSYKSNHLDIVLTESKLPATISDYFTSGDKINKIMAIESFRLFYKIPDLNMLSIVLDLNGGKSNLEINRKEIEKYYGIKSDDIREYFDNGFLKVGNKWRGQFLSRYDSKQKRAKFATKFVKITK